MKKKWIDNSSSLVFVLTAIFSSIHPFILDAREKWWIFIPLLFSLLVSFGIKMMPKYSGRKIWSWFYRWGIVGTFEVMNNYETYDYKHGEKEKTCFKSTKKVIWTIKSDNNDNLIIISKSNQAISTGKLISLKNEGAIQTFVFKYHVEGLEKRDGLVPEHSGIHIIKMDNNKIISSHYLNAKPGFGTFTNIKKIN